MNILVLYPYNLRSIEQESVMEMLVKEGNNVTLLTTCGRGPLHEFVPQLGVKAEAAGANEQGNPVIFYYQCVRYFLQIARKYKIDAVIAQQQVPAIVAGIGRRFKGFKLIYVRHNTDETVKNFPVKGRLINWLANTLTTVKVAPSEIVKEYWSEEEKVSASTIHRVNYGYNFSRYPKADLGEAQRIRDQFQAKMLIVSIARLVPAKRHDFMFEIVRRLREKGIDCRMICLGTGYLHDSLTEKIASLHLSDRIFLLGRKENKFDYLAAGDVFLHLSDSEASNDAVKEAGLSKKAVVACKRVGDFEDYIENGVNGFVVDKDHPVDEATEILEKIATGMLDPAALGQSLYNTIINRYDIGNVKDIYKKLLTSA